jgi:hypothetical protein
MEAQAARDYPVRWSNRLPADLDAFARRAKHRFPWYHLKVCRMNSRSMRASVCPNCDGSSPPHLCHRTPKVPSEGLPATPSSAPNMRIRSELESALHSKHTYASPPHEAQIAFKWETSTSLRRASTQSKKKPRMSGAFRRGAWGLRGAGGGLCPSERPTRRSIPSSRGHAR